MIYGLDLLGAAKYASTALKSFPRGLACGVFAQEFGDALPFVKALAATGKAPIIRVQLLWGGNSHSYGDKNIPALVREAKRYERLKTQCKIELSWATEHRNSNPDKYCDIVQNAAPSCVVVNNPQEGMGAFSRRYKNEVHTGRPPPWGAFNYSADGQSSADADNDADAQKYGAAEVLFLWVWQFNCHFNSEDKTRNTRPTGELITAVSKLAGTRGAVSLPPKWLWKSFAEQSDEDGDSRSNKPVCITPINVPFLELVKNGRVIGRLPKYKDKFIDGRNRYYLEKWGWKVSQGIVDLRANGKKVGTVNPGFRSAPYR